MQDQMMPTVSLKPTEKVLRNKAALRFLDGSI